MKADMDRKKFAELFSKYTKVGKANILKVLETHKVNDILQNPNLVTTDVSKMARINELKLLRNTYDNLKEYDKKYTINSPTKAVDFFLNHNMDIQDKEYFSIAYLNTKNEVIDVKSTEGAINYALIDVREIMKEAFRLNASGIIVSHNHPSGNPSPSPEDLSMTGRIYAAGQILNINLMDHVITGNMNYYSIKEKHGDLSNLKGTKVIEKSGIYESEKKKETIKDKLEAAKSKSNIDSGKLNNKKDIER